jgi:vacuolar-type H+-ATPase subunit E/Vma4
MRHFETIWEEAELLTDDKSVSSHIEKINELLLKLEEQPSIIGEVLLELSAISSILNINVAAALDLAIESRKVEIYE